MSECVDFLVDVLTTFISLARVLGEGPVQAESRLGATLVAAKGRRERLQTLQLQSEAVSKAP